MANIKQIRIGDTLYDVEALHFIAGDLDSPAQWKAYIDNLVGKGLQIVIDTQASGKEEPATPASAETMGKLYMVTIAGQKAGTYTEFVTIEVPEGTYKWEKIGTTEADLTDYVKKGTYESEESASFNTGNAGADTVTSGNGGAQTATGSATISYQKSDNKTGSAGGDTVGTTKAGEAVISGASFTFTGSAETLTAAVDGVELDDHSFTPVGTIVNTPVQSSTTSINNVTGAVLAATPTFKGTENTISVSTLYTPAGSITGSQAIAAHSHGVNAATETVSISTAPASTKGIKVNTTTASTASVGISGGIISGATPVNVVTDVAEVSLSAETSASTGTIEFANDITGSAPSLGGTTAVPTNAIKDFTLSASTVSTAGPGYFAGATVNTDGVLSFDTKYMGHSTTVADKNNVTISGGSYNATKKYMKVSGGGVSSSTPVIPSYSQTPIGLTGTTVFVTSAINSAVLAEDTSASAPFKFNTDAIKSASSNQAFVKSATLSPDGSATIDFGNAEFEGTRATIAASTLYTPAGTISKPSITLLSTPTVVATDGIKSVTSEFVGGAVTIEHTFTDGASGAFSIDYTPKGSIGGSATIASHSHSVTISSHTHSIALTAETVTGAAAVAVSDHTHSVVIKNHTHSVGAHTHDVDLRKSPKAV